MDDITVDGLEEHEFRYEIEDMLRLDQVEEAVARLRSLLEPYARDGRILPARFLEVGAGDLQFTGWDRLAARIGDHDRPGHPITAIGIVLADARVLGGPGPKGGLLAPFIKTYYFSDDAYPFTEASRDDLLDGYSREGFGWQSDYQASDATIAIKGIDDLHGAIIALEDRLLDCPNPDPEQIRAGSIGACYLAVLIHQGLRDTLRNKPLPRPLCVLAACDGVYPFFDAPVIGSDGCTLPPPPPADGGEDETDEVWPNELAGAPPSPAAGPAAEGSLLGLATPRGHKALALTLGEDDAREAERFTQEASALRLVMDDDSKLKGLFHNVPAADLVPLDYGDETEAEAEAESREGAAAAPEEARCEPALASPLLAEAQDALPEPPRADTFVPPPTPQERFRMAEETASFPTGRGLRQRFHADPELVGPSPGERLSAALFRFRVKTRAQLAAARLKATTACVAAWSAARARLGRRR